MGEVMENFLQKEIYEGEADWDKCALRHIYQAYKATAAP